MAAVAPTSTRTTAQLGENSGRFGKDELAVSSRTPVVKPSATIHGESGPTE